ncbi:MAG: NUDIX domain-containing protein [Eubacteriales bacterium]
MDGRLRNMASVYIVRDEKILLLYRIGSRVVSPSWCGIGGHFEQDELNNARKCVLRELKEEINLDENDIYDLKLRYIALRLKDNEVRQNYYYFAKLKENVQITLECNEGIPQWFPLDEINGLDMPFTAKHMIKHYTENGRYNDLLYGSMASDSGMLFSILNEF